MNLHIGTPSKFDIQCNAFGSITFTRALQIGSIRIAIGASSQSVMSDEKSPLAAAREFPETRPLKGPFATARDSAVNMLRQRVGKCGTIMTFAAAASLVGAVIVILVLVGPARSSATCADDAAVSYAALCVPAFFDYRLIDALYGRLPREVAEGYLTSWPTSLATRYMADSAMWHGPQPNASVARPIAYNVLSALVDNEPLPSGATSWCTLHIAWTSLGLSTLPGSLEEMLLYHNLTVVNCPHVHVLASAPVLSCASSRATLEDGQAHVRTMRHELCSRGYATSVMLGLPPDEILALLSRSRAGLSYDADVDALAINLRRARSNARRRS